MLAFMRHQAAQWLCGLALCVFSSIAAAEHWQLYTEDNPPLSNDVSGQAVGFAPALLREMTQQLGLSAQIRLFPWARAMHAAQQREHSALFVTIRTEEREHLFKWVGPIVSVGVGFYALKSNQLQINSAQELATLPSIGTIRAWFNYDDIQAMPLDNIVSVSTPQQLFRLLQHGRVSVITADELNTNSPPIAGMAWAQLEQVYPLGQVQGYIALHINTPDAEVERWQNALDSLKSNGRLLELHRQWLPGIPSSMIHDAQ